jgi:uncharacterized protein
MQGAGRLFAYVLILMVLLSLGLCGVLLMFQRSLIYFPRPRSNQRAVMMQVPSPAGPVLVSTRPAAGSEALIYFGGNAEDVSLNLPDFSQAFPNHAIYLLHYPGYGGSAGCPSEKSIMAAAFALFDTVHAMHPDVVVIGRSLGTGVAVQVAAARPIVRLVLVTPFDSLTDVAAAHFPFIPVRWLLSDKYDSWKYAPQVTAPTRIIVAGKDEIIPRATTERLGTRFKAGNVSRIVIPNVGHNAISDDPEYLSLLSQEHLPAAGGGPGS